MFLHDITRTSSQSIAYGILIVEMECVLCVAPEVSGRILFSSSLQTSRSWGTTGRQLENDYRQKSNILHRNKL
jgi:hypothetical protein